MQFTRPISNNPNISWLAENNDMYWDDDNDEDEQSSNANPSAEIPPQNSQCSQTDSL